MLFEPYQLGTLTLQNRMVMAPMTRNRATADLAKPDLLQRFEDEIPLAAPDPTTFYTPGADGYTDYAVAAASAR